MAVKGGGSLLLRFLVPLNAKGAQEENATHGDLMSLRNSIADSGPATCAARVLEALRTLASDERSFDFLMVADDDVWFSAPRLLIDLRALLGHPQHVLYGQLAFAAGWNDRRPSTHIGHHGWSAFSNVESWLPRHAPRRRSLRRDKHPFPFLMGYSAVLSAGLVQELARSAAVDRLISQLLATASSRTPPQFLPKGKCYPGTDVAVGWAIQMLPTSLPLTAVDITYANRALPWVGWRAATEVSRRAAIVHNISDWEWFRWALCLSTGEVAEVPGREGKRPRAEVAPIVRCRGRAAPTLRCGAMGCRGPASSLHNGSACATTPACATYFERTFANWTFCIAVGSRRTQRTSLPEAMKRVCVWSREDVLRRCQGVT